MFVELDTEITVAVREVEAFLITTPQTGLHMPNVKQLIVCLRSGSRLPVRTFDDPTKAHTFKNKCVERVQKLEKGLFCTEERE